MAKVIKASPDQVYKPQYGDILFGDEYFLPLKSHTMDGNFIHLDVIDPNAWNSLRQLGVECKDFKFSVAYVCLYTNYATFWAVPVALFTEDAAQYRKDRYINNGDMACDSKWNRDMYPEDRLFERSVTATILMGTGYTECTNMCDGGLSLKKLWASLDNGDRLLCHVWEWHNK